MKENILKVLHSADLHLGSAFGNIPAEIGAILRREQKNLLFQMIRLCREEAVDLLLLAGDLFDRPLPGKEIVRLFSDCMQEIPQTEVFITPGNHDPFLMDSPWESASWPANVHVFSPERQTFICSGKPVQVDGSAFSSYLAGDSLFKGVPRQVPADFFRLLMWHGDLTDQSSEYNPLSPGAPFLDDYDYVALGHIHKESETTLHSGSVIVRYPGCPQGRGFDELGAFGFWIGELSKVKEGILAQSWCKIPAGARPFLWINCDLTGCLDIEQVKSSILAAVKKETAALPGPNTFQKSLIRLVLQGRLPEDLALDPSFVENYLKSQGCFFIQVRVETRVIRDLQRLAGQPGFTGMLVQNYLHRMAKAQNEQERQELEQALEFALQAGQGEL